MKKNKTEDIIKSYDNLMNSLRKLEFFYDKVKANQDLIKEFLNDKSRLN